MLKRDAYASRNVNATLVVSSTNAANTPAEDASQRSPELQAGVEVDCDLVRGSHTHRHSSRRRDAEAARLPPAVLLMAVWMLPDAVELVQQSNSFSEVNCK